MLFRSEADIAVLNVKPSEFVEWRMQFAETVWDKLFILQTLALDTMNKATYVVGKKVYDETHKERFMYAADIK